MPDVPVRPRRANFGPAGASPPQQRAKRLGRRALTVHHLEPIRTCLSLAQLACDGLRFAAEDEVAREQLLPVEAQRRDVLQCGRDLHAQLAALREEIDVLTQRLREEAPHA
jgi:hypothetical protein